MTNLENKMRTAIEKLNHRSILARTQVKNLEDSFIYKTYDKAPLIIEVYGNNNGQWFVIKTNAFVAWTRDASIIFTISGNCSIFTLREIAQLVEKSKRDTALPASNNQSIEDFL